MELTNLIIETYNETEEESLENIYRELLNVDNDKVLIDFSNMFNINNNEDVSFENLDIKELASEIFDYYSDEEIEKLNLVKEDFISEVSMEDF